uniref:Limb development membrane protein 1 n=1 Tax=Lates calcarifer TaxID=8187 RepID=A0A4W6FH34_LATCA
MGSLLRWTGALEHTRVLPAASACPDASLRERVWDVAEVPESIPPSPLLPQGNEMRSDVDSSPLLVSLCCSLSLFLSIALHLPLFFLFDLICSVEHSPHCPVELGCEMVDCSIHLVYTANGIKARILETFVMLFLLALLILGIVWVASALIDNDAASMESLYDLWEFYLPYLYSCISLMGGLLLLMCTPVGLSRMFTVMGQLLVKPTILEDLDEQIYCIHLQEEALQRRLNGSSSHTYTRGSFAHQLNKELDNIRNQRNKLERRKKASGWEKNLLYPIVMLILLAGTTISVLMVALNILYLLVDETAMPKGSTDRAIGNTSLSTFGVAQAVLEIILMFYLMVSSVVGFYSLRVFEGLTPRKDDTTMTTIIGCCVSILVLSSALPVMSRTLGITRFDLLGDFGRFNWLGNFYIVLSYNLLFAVVTTLCLVRKFTSAVREELLKALGLDKLQLSNSPTDPESGKLSANGHQKTL